MFDEARVLGVWRLSVQRLRTEFEVPPSRSLTDFRSEILGLGLGLDSNLSSNGVSGSFGVFNPVLPNQFQEDICHTSRLNVLCILLRDVRRTRRGR